MLKINESGRAIHFPANPAKFEFDGEVAKVFQDIAERSIPNFHAAHAAHVSMAGSLLSKPGCRILDIGASLGHFYDHVLQAEHYDTVYVAVDNSKPMCDALEKKHHEAHVHCMDLCSDEFQNLIAGPPFDIVVCNYILQFLPPERQIGMLVDAARVTAKGGLLFLGHKSQHTGSLGDLAHEEYIKFRLGNGYTREEVEAKTKALKGSMFPMSHQFVMGVLRSEFSQVQETTRFMMFSTVAAQK